MASNETSGQPPRPTGWPRLGRVAAGLVVAWLLVAGLGTVAYLTISRTAAEVATRSTFHERVAATRRLHLAALHAEDAWAQYMASGANTDLVALSGSIGDAGDQRNTMVEVLAGLPGCQDDLEQVLPRIDTWLADLQSLTAQRPSLDPASAADVVARWHQEDAIGQIGGLLTPLAADLEAHWESADAAVRGIASNLRLGVTAVTVLGLGTLSVVMLLGWREARRRARTQASLQVSEAYNRGLIEASLDALLTVTPGLMIDDVNEAMCRMSGRPRRELVGSLFSGYFSDPGRAADAVARAFEQGSVTDYDLTLRAEDGTEILVSFNAAIYRDPATGAVRGIIAAARDVTQARHLQRHLADQQAYSRGLIEASVDALATIDLEGQIADVNRQMEVLIGVTRQELIGSRFDQLFTDPEGAREGVRRVLAEGRVTDCELVASGHDGRQTPVSCNATTFFDARGNLQGVFVAARDITARERALQQANRSLEAFTYSVAHDLRAPLRALSGFAEALAEEYGPQLGDTGRDYANRLQRASERMGRLIDDLLHLAYLARAELRIERVDLSRLAWSVAEDLRREDPGRQVALVIEEGASAWADPRLIRTVMENLLGNAWKFTGKRPDARIEFGSAPAEPGWRAFHVRDDGVGFDPAYKDKLFRPFERLHSAEEFPGSGIGLASVARIIERHGGRAWADSDQAEGTTFHFTLRAEEVGP